LDKRKRAAFVPVEVDFSVGQPSTFALLQAGSLSRPRFGCHSLPQSGPDAQARVSCG
jgi:hypothetical protein